MEAWKFSEAGKSAEMLEAMEDGVLVVEGEEICRFANGALRTYLDLPRKNVCDVSLAHFLKERPDLLLSWRECLRRVQRERRSLRSEDKFCVGDRQFSCEALFSPLPGDGAPVVVVCRDTTARRRAEDALREREKQFRTLFENTVDVAWVFGLDKKLDLVSPAVKELLGYSPEECMAMPLEKLMTSASWDLVSRLLEKELRQDNPAPGPRGTRYLEIDQVRKDGSVVPTEVSTAFVRNGEGKLMGVLGFTRDISERRRGEAELRAAKEAAEEGVRAKSRFLAHMSHEIRTPIHAVLGMSELLLDTPLSAEQGDFARTIHESAESLLALLNDVLDYSKMEADRLVVERRPFCLRQVVDAAVSLVAQEARRKGLALHVRVDDVVPKFVEGDAVRLRQILVNLLGNAVKFTSRGEVRLEVSFDASSVPPKLLAFVRDTGIGIPTDRLGDLFQSFNQLDASTTRRYGGTGLGLAISRRLVELLGGSMTVESSGVGQGATFHFAVVAPPASGDEEKDASSGGHGPFDRTLGERHPLRILLVDDDPVHRKVGTHMLRHLGYAPDTVSSGEEALSQLREHPYDVVLLDVRMPGMDGLEAARRLQDVAFSWRRPWVVAMTAHVVPKSSAWCREEGVDDFLGKPVRARELREVLLRCAEARGGAVERDFHNEGERRADAPEDVAPLPLVDAAALRRLLADLGEGAWEDLRDVVRAYLRHSPDVLAGMEDALFHQDRDRLERGAHTLKSTSAALGARSFAHLCERLEEESQDHMPSDAEERVAALRRTFIRTEPQLLKVLDALEKT